MPAIAASDRTREPETPAAPLAARRKGWVRGFFFWALSLFLLGMGMKLLMMEPCLNALPYYDQWEAEGAEIYVPYYQHTLRFLGLFHAQNEHRIFFTHVYDLALLLLNKQWDSQLQMVVNAPFTAPPLRASRGCWPASWAVATGCSSGCRARSP